MEHATARTHAWHTHTPISSAHLRTTILARGRVQREVRCGPMSGQNSGHNVCGVRARIFPAAYVPTPLATSQILHRHGRLLASLRLLLTITTEDEITHGGVCVMLVARRAAHSLLRTPKRGHGGERVTVLGHGRTRYGELAGRWRRLGSLEWAYIRMYERILRVPYLASCISALLHACVLYLYVCESL